MKPNFTEKIKRKVFEKALNKSDEREVHLDKDAFVSSTSEVTGLSSVEIKSLIDHEVAKKKFRKMIVATALGLGVVLGSLYLNHKGEHGEAVKHADLQYPEQQGTATKYYTKVSGKAFPVFLHKGINMNDAYNDLVFKQILEDLHKIRTMIPALAYDKIKNTPLWISEGKKFPNRTSGFHHSPQWLAENDFNPHMAPGIEIVNFSNYSKVMFGNYMSNFIYCYSFEIYKKSKAARESIRNAYEMSVKNKIYNSEMSEQSYFSHISSIYWCGSNSFPHTVEELKMHDPIGYKAVKAA